MYLGIKTYGCAVVEAPDDDVDAEVEDDSAGPVVKNLDVDLLYTEDHLDHSFALEEDHLGHNFAKKKDLPDRSFVFGVGPCAFGYVEEAECDCAGLTDRYAYERAAAGAPSVYDWVLTQVPGRHVCEQGSRN